MTSVQRLRHRDAKIEPDATRNRAWPRALRREPQAEGPGDGAQGREGAASDDPHCETPPNHTDWLFSACEPHIADLVHRIDVRLSGRTKRVLQFIGANRGAGASTVAFAYASALAALRQRRVLLLSADEGRGAPGVLACVSGGRPLSDAISTLHGTLSYGALNCELTSDRDAEMLMADVAVWRKIGEAFDEVVVDCRPVDISLGALAIASRADGVVVVIEAGRTLETSAQALLDSLDAVNAPVLGAVLNHDTWEGRSGSRGDDE
ncbi:hypothetical protein P3W85_36145 [Cupriavidus basilensis]|uniref:CpsD/CapB family tyrosine-protein kinase n=1 Tax=Cupriavidus basilensis TaxID=68895 RepID=A0ABT6B0C0_9BURK|nr:hypothetical protein [Cupriavidus basilensis]MDF3838322.1 hypothetical protein [Cupriavidus basilensis]